MTNPIQGQARMPADQPPRNAAEGVRNTAAPFSMERPIAAFAVPAPEQPACEVLHSATTRQKTSHMSGSLESIVQDQLRGAFGSLADDRMLASVVEQLRTNPDLRRMFAQASAAPSGSQAMRQEL